ncbi:hypothetical protein EVAR_40174_1 [Eumeta japonica]|uniref:Uncharacterized protein n=1 Tax=Eumeta variegata TaxID=151549 RepID=A0A4C1XLA2_EUMVA|nr:hypothetical protein EVAR_40174_1 [Eumeta japonica]
MNKAIDGELYPVREVKEKNYPNLVDAELPPIHDGEDAVKPHAGCDPDVVHPETDRLRFKVLIGVLPRTLARSFILDRGASYTLSPPRRSGPDRTTMSIAIHHRRVDSVPHRRLNASSDTRNERFDFSIRCLQLFDSFLTYGNEHAFRAPDSDFKLPVLDIVTTWVTVFYSSPSPLLGHLGLSSEPFDLKVDELLVYPVEAPEHYCHKLKKTAAAKVGSARSTPDPNSTIRKKDIEVGYDFAMIKIRSKIPVTQLSKRFEGEYRRSLETVGWYRNTSCVPPTLRRQTICNPRHQQWIYGLLRTKIHYIQYNARNCAAVKLVTKASQCRKTSKLGKRRKGRGVLDPRITSYAGNSERQSFVRCSARYRQIDKKPILFSISISLSL